MWSWYLMRAVDWVEKKKEKRVLENNSAASWRFEGFLSTAHAALKSSPHLLTSVTFSRSDYFRLLLVVWQHALAAFPLVHPLLTAITSPAFRPPHLPLKNKDLSPLPISSCWSVFYRSILNTTPSSGDDGLESEKGGERIKNCKNAASDPQQKPFEGAAATERVTREPH